MEKLDQLVTDQLIDRLLAPDRLSSILEALIARRGEKSTAVDNRIKSLNERAADADEP